jgi:hypothetical protein
LKSDSNSCFNSSNEQGLYSVKNASIRYENNYNNNNHHNEVVMTDSRMSSSPNGRFFVNAVETNNLSPISFSQNCLLKVSDSSYQVDANLAKNLTNQNKESILKNDLISNSNNEFIKKSSIYDSYYLSSKDILLNPNEIIASIV